MLTAYVGKKLGDGMGVDRFGETSRRELIDGHGAKIGTCAIGKGWRINSAYGTHMYVIYATVEGREYHGRGFGEGMSVCLRETAESRRKR